VKNYLSEPNASYTFLIAIYSIPVFFVLKLSWSRNIMEKNSWFRSLLFSAVRNVILSVRLSGCKIIRVTSYSLFSFCVSPTYVKPRTNLFHRVQRITSHCVVPADVDEPLLSIILRGKKFAHAAEERESSASYTLCVWCASLVPQRSVFRSREFLVREGSNIKFAPKFVRSLSGYRMETVAKPRNSSRASAAPWRSRYSYSSLNYTKCPSLHEKKAKR